jgi:hypothetical protein
MKHLKIALVSAAALVLTGLRRPFSTANVEGTVGTHEKAIGRYTDAAIPTRYLLVKKGSDADHIALCGAGDVPLGTVDDEASAAEKRVHVNLLGKGPSKKMVASGAIGAGVRVYAAAGGKIAAAGTVEVGISLTAAAADNDILEVNDR